MPASEAEDFKTEPVNSGQSMYIMACAVGAMISTFIKPEDTEEEKVGISLALLSFFLYQLLIVAKHKDKVIKILEALIQELKDASTEQAPKL